MTATTQQITAAIVTYLSSKLPDWTILDLSTTTDAIDPRALPCLFPEKRGNFMSNFRVEFASTGGQEGNRALTLTYTLQYTLAYSHFGEGRGVADNAGVEDAIKALLLAALQVDALGSTVVGVNEFIPSEIKGDGMVLDYDNNRYYGYLVLFQITELIG